MSFEELSKARKKIQRYHEIKIMFYRTDNYVHVQRVKILLKTIIIPAARMCGISFDEKKALIIAEHHDDHEIVSRRNDVMLKRKLQMDLFQKERLKAEELKAIQELLKKCPEKVEGYSFEEILMAAYSKKCVESQLVSIADKLDGFGEAIHEVLAGNAIFVEAVINYSLRTFSQLSRSYDLLPSHFFHLKNIQPLTEMSVADLTGYFNGGLVQAKVHDEESIHRPVSIPHYHIWRNATLKLPNGIDLLIKQKEFFT